MKFGKLEPSQKVGIFSSFLDQLAANGMVEGYDEILEWFEDEGKRMDFNGRQIRNIISTALSIALAGKRNLRKRDVASIARKTNELKMELADEEAVFRNKHIRSTR